MTQEKNSERGTQIVPEKLAALFGYLETGLYERSVAIRLCLLAAIAGESVFLLGPPGVAKSLLARRLQQAFQDARCFDYLMGRFSTPEEIFGPISIKRLKEEDLYVRRTDKYLPEADIVFLDEIWKAGPPIQNALLTALNEKIFRNGHEEIHLPLKLLIAASNETASDDAAQAFWDRFLVRFELNPLQDPASFSAMLGNMDDPYRDVVPESCKLQTALWQSWQAQAGTIPLSAESLAFFGDLRQRLQVLHQEVAGPYVSDRRWKKLAGLVRATAFCQGRTVAELMDCFVVEHGLWNVREEQTAVRTALREAMRQQAGSHHIRLEMLQQDLQAIRQSFQAETSRETELSVLEPDLVDGEYYRLMDVPLELLVRGDIPVSELRIWKMDWDTLPVLPASPRSCEFFLYSQGQYQGTASLACRRVEAWNLELADRVYSLRCQESRTVQRHHFEPDAASWRMWETRLSEFECRCQMEATRISQAIADIAVQVSSHFFVPVDALEPMTARLHQYLVDLSELQASARGCLETRGDC